MPHPVPAATAQTHTAEYMRAGMTEAGRQAETHSVASQTITVMKQGAGQLKETVPLEATGPPLESTDW